METLSKIASINREIIKAKTHKVKMASKSISSNKVNLGYHHPWMFQSGRDSNRNKIHFIGNFYLWNELPLVVTICSENTSLSKTH